MVHMVAPSPAVVQPSAQVVQAVVDEVHAVRVVVAVALSVVQAGLVLRGDIQGVGARPCSSHVAVHCGGQGVDGGGTEVDGG